MSLCPARRHPADTQAGSLGSAAQSVLVSGRLGPPGEGQALAIESLWWVVGVAALDLQEAPLSSRTEETVYKTNLSPQGGVRSYLTSWQTGHCGGALAPGGPLKVGLLIRVGGGCQGGVRLPVSLHPCPVPYPLVQAVSTRATSTGARRPSDCRRVAAACTAPVR